MSGDPASSAPTTHPEQAIRSVTRAIAARQPGADLLALVAEQACLAVNAASVAIGVRSGDDGLLNFVAVAGAERSEFLGLKVRVDDSLAEAALRTGAPVVFDNTLVVDRRRTQGDRRRVNLGPPGGVERRVGPPDRRRPGPCCAVLPILRDGEVTGALFARIGAGHANLSASTLETLALFADLAGVAIARDEAARTVEEQRRELDALLEATRAVSSGLDVQAILTSVLDAVRTHLDHQTAAIFLLNDARTHLFIAADHGLAEEEREVQLAADAPWTASLLQSSAPKLIGDAARDPELDVLSDGGRVRSAIIAPIRNRDNPLGLMIVTSGQPDAYGPNDLALLQALATQAGVAIENAWLYEDATRRAEEAGTLYDLSQHITGTLERDRILQFVADRVPVLLNVDQFALLLYDPREDCLAPSITRGIDEKHLRALHAGPGEGISGWVYEWSTPTAVSDVSADARNRTRPIDEVGAASCLCVPMTHGDRVIGVLLAMSSQRRLFTVAEMELLYTIANQTAVAIANARLYADQRMKTAAMGRYFQRLARALGATLGPQDVPQMMADLALEVMRGDRCTIYRVGPNHLELAAAAGFRASSRADAALPQTAGLAARIAKQGKPLSSASAPEEPGYREEPWLGRERILSYLGVPMKVGRRTVGVMEIGAQEVRAFTVDEIKLLAQFSRRARVAERLAGRD